MVCWCSSFLSRFSLIFENHVLYVTRLNLFLFFVIYFLCFLALLYPFRVDVTEFPFYGFLLLDGLLYYFLITVEFGFWSILGWCFLVLRCLNRISALGLYLALFVLPLDLVFIVSYFFLELLFSMWQLSCYLFYLMFIYISSFFLINFAQLQIEFNWFLMGFLFLV